MSETLGLEPHRLTAPVAINPLCQSSTKTCHDHAWLNRILKLYKKRIKAQRKSVWRRSDRKYFYSSLKIFDYNNIATTILACAGLFVLNNWELWREKQDQRKIPNKITHIWKNDNGLLWSGSLKFKRYFSPDFKWTDNENVFNAWKQ